MQVIIWKRYRNGPRLYLMGGDVWSADPDNAKRYTFRGAETVLNKLEKLWIVSADCPNGSGYFVDRENEAA